MRAAGYKVGKTFLCRLEHNSNLVRSIEGFAKDKKIKMGVFTALGSVKKATLAYYDPKKKIYQKISIDKPLEIVNVFGNISLKNRKTFSHAHAILSDPSGKTYGGHLLRATIFAAEAYIQELIGGVLEREYDLTTGLALWNL